MIKFRCGRCAQKIGVPDNLAGHHVKCPRCNDRVLVQAASVGVKPAAAPQAPPRPNQRSAPVVAEESPEPTRITRGQTLDLDHKSPERSTAEAADEGVDEAPVSARVKQASLMSLAGIDPAAPIAKGGTSAARGDSSAIALSETAPNWPGIAAAIAAFTAGVLISVGTPTLLTLVVAGGGLLAGLAGMVVSFTNRRWEYWSAVVGASLSLVVLVAAYAIGASRDAAAVAAQIKGSNPVAGAQHRQPTPPNQTLTAAVPLRAVVPNRCR